MAFMLVLSGLAGIPELTSQHGALAQSNVPVTVTITKVRCVEDCDEEGLESTLESTPDFYAVIYINGESFTTTRADDDQSDIEPFGWTVTKTIDATQPPAPQIPVTIQIWDYDSSSGDDNGDTSPVPDKNNLDLVVDLNTGRWSGDTTNSCVTGDGVDTEDTEYYPLEVCFDISVKSASGDADGDGLLDGWEQFGLDADGNGVVDVDLPAMGAKLDHKDLFLELDYETGRPPSRDGINAMKAAFAAAPVGNPDGTSGITLHVDVGTLIDVSADEAGVTGTCANGIDDDGDGTVDGGDPNCVYLDASREAGFPGNCGDNIDNDGDGQVDGNDPNCLVGENLGGGNALTTVGSCGLDAAFYTAKQSFFDTKRRWVFHYAIQAATAPAPGCTPSGGEGEIGGNDFVSHNLDAGTLMHELGHNLNLRHGGSVDDNCKPNYLSVMNYNLQRGIPQTAGGLILDYSPPRTTLNGSARAAAPLGQLVENALDETVPIDAADAQSMTRFMNGLNQLVLTNVNVSPNWNGDTDPPVESSLPPINIDNGIPATATTPGVGAAGCANTATNSTLKGDNDWNRIQLAFRQFGDSASGAIDPSNEISPTEDELEQIDQNSRTTDLIAGLTVTPDPVAAGTMLTLTATIANAGPNPSMTSVLTITIPAETSLDGTAPAPCEQSTPGVIECAYGKLLAGENRSVTLSALVPPDLVYLNGSPLSITGTAMVANLSGNDLDPASNSVTASVLAIAVADLSVDSFELPNPPVQMKVGESVVIAVDSIIDSAGPSSPMDTTLTLTGSADAGASISPTTLLTAQTALASGEQRPVEDHFIISCQRPGVHTFEIGHSIAPTRIDDSDPNSSNNEQSVRFEVECTGRIEVRINILPGRWPNEVGFGTRELAVGVMTTDPGEYPNIGAFDASWILPDTVFFGSERILDGSESGVNPWATSALDLRDLEEPIPPESALDGDDDAFFLFDTQQSGLTPQDTRGCVVGIYLDPTTGEKHDFFGCDAIRFT